MSTYAIGDIHGCYDSLQRLLTQLSYNEQSDTVWLVGDLVNRGPNSLEVLRWARRTPKLVCVLGNHDLHLLRRHAGLAPEKQRDTLDQILEAPDCDELLRWLRAQPLIYREDDWVLVHAGVPPHWSLKAAEQRAREVESILSSEDWPWLLDVWRGSPAEDRHSKASWRRCRSTSPEQMLRYRETLDGLTRMRTCTPDGTLDFQFKGKPAEAPKGLRPWFDVREMGSETIICGHWSALGCVCQPGLLAIDSGCVWGGPLTAVRLDDGVLTEAR